MQARQVFEEVDEALGEKLSDIIFNGPEDTLTLTANDLTTTMGIPNEYDHPDLIAQLQKIIDISNRSHVAAGCWFGKRDQAERTMRQGARFVVYSNDGSLLKDAMEHSFGHLRRI